MQRILLVLEDYNELLFLGTILKKLGFDVESIRTEVNLAERMMAFSPELVIATGDGHKITGQKVSKKVKKKGNHARLLLLYPRAKIKSIDLMSMDADGVVETPLSPRSIISSVCQMMGLDADQMTEKFDKMGIGKESHGNENMHIVSGKNGNKKKPATPYDDPARAEKYQKIVTGEPDDKKISVFPHNKVQDFLKDIREYEKTNDLKDLEEQRKRFVVELFSKKK